MKHQLAAGGEFDGARESGIGTGGESDGALPVITGGGAVPVEGVERGASPHLSDYLIGRLGEGASCIEQGVQAGSLPTVARHGLIEQGEVTFDLQLALGGGEGVDGGDDAIEQNDGTHRGAVPVRGKHPFAADFSVIEQSVGDFIEPGASIDEKIAGGAEADGLFIYRETHGLFELQAFDGERIGVIVGVVPPDGAIDIGEGQRLSGAGEGEGKEIGHDELASGEEGGEGIGPHSHPGHRRVGGYRPGAHCKNPRQSCGSKGGLPGNGPVVTCLADPGQGHLPRNGSGGGFQSKARSIQGGACLNAAGGRYRGHAHTSQ